MINSRMHTGFAFARLIHPVGHGGFVSETIMKDGFTVVYDCGSRGKGHDRLLSREINRLKRLTGRIDKLVISHFDEDHVNGLSSLVSEFPIGEVIIPAIPKDFHLVYDILTGEAYTRILNLFEGRAEIRRIIETSTIYSSDDLWEWIAYPLLSPRDWQNLRIQMLSHSVNMSMLNDVHYIESNLRTIKKCFVLAFGSAKMNENGIVMLSQAFREPGRWHCIIDHHMADLGSLFHRTSAFYTGDTNLKGRKKGDVMSFIERYCGRNRLGLVQIPHHGSKSNSSSSFVADFPSDLYFYQDRSMTRLLGNIGLYTQLFRGKNVFGIHSSSFDLFSQFIIVP